ncbi:hypothetical protein ACLB1N_05260 [Escherichia coli]
MAISGLRIAFAALLAAGLIRSGQIFLPGRWIHWQIPLIRRNLLCCFLCLVDGNATSCIAYHGGACYVGNA